MRVTTLIADDEPIARAGLRSMLVRHDWLEIVGETGDGPATIEAIERLKPELVLLDIQMPGLSGIDVLGQLEHIPFVVFTTAHSEHAVTAFELGAVDYVLKPFGSVRLAKAIERVRSAIGEPAAQSSLDRLAQVFGRGPISRLFVRRGATVLPVSIDRVSRFSADGDYVVAHAESTRHLIHLALSRLESRLDPKKFVRIHRAHIVNLDFVKNFHRSRDGNVAALMSDGTHVPVSRTRAQELRAVIV